MSYDERDVYTVENMISLTECKIAALRSKIVFCAKYE